MAKWPLLALLAMAVACGPKPVPTAKSVPAAPGASQSAPAAPLDPQRVEDQQDMTWADYRPIPGVNWADPSLTPSKR